MNEGASLLATTSTAVAKKADALTRSKQQKMYKMYPGDGEDAKNWKRETGVGLW